MANDKSKSIFSAIIAWFEQEADWVQENLGDPAIAEMLRQDLGLAPGSSIPDTEKDKFKQYGARSNGIGLDPDKVAFEETIAEIKDVVADLSNLGDTLKSDGLTGWDVAYLLGRVASAESIRLHFPVVYAVAKLALLISDDPDALEELEPALLVKLLRGDALPVGSGELFLQRLSAGLGLLVTIADSILKKSIGPGLVSASYGWDAAPDSAVPQADRIASRAMTLLLGDPDPKIGQLGVTILGVPPEHGGPGLFLSFGGKLAIDQTIENTTYRFATGAGGAFDLFIPFGEATQKFQASGDPQSFVQLKVVQGNPSQPALRLGEPGKTRLEVGKLGWGLDLNAERAGVLMSLEQAALIISLGEESFLKQLQSGELRVDFNLGVVVDTKGGVHLEGGNRLQVSIPVGNSFLGIFTIYRVGLTLGPSPSGRDLALEISGAFSLKLGPFRASVNGVGFLLDLKLAQGNLGFIDLALGFKPPNGIGLVLDAAIVKGGGSLLIDAARGEYAGALELRIGPVGVKAIVILSTRMSDGSPGWALMMMIYGQFPPIQLSFGFTLTGIGGMIGLQHSVNLDALQAGMSSGVLDDILFPRDPVADAPRIINRLRVVFPSTARALIIAPMLEIGWGTPNLVTLRLGIILQLDNVLGSGDRPVSLSKILLIGQLLLQLPMKVDGDLVILKILVDFIGYLDFDNHRLGFVARLRDSRLAGRLELTGMLIIRIDFGTQPTFVLSAGGFHPRYKDIPSGLPAPIDRLGLSFQIGRLIKVEVQIYFAITPATVQAGASIRLSASLGPVKISGFLGFDAICYLEPYFHFIVELTVQMAVKFKGYTLLGIDVKMSLEGPGHWHAKGTGFFKILLWTVPVDFDESWGSAPSLPPATTSVAERLQAALQEAGSWSAQLPNGGESLVTLGPVAGATGILAHPFGQLTLTQKVVPLGLTIQRFGNSGVAGANRFEIKAVTIGEGKSIAYRTTQEFFARSQFLDLTQDEKLTTPSFERFNAGIVVGGGDYQMPTAIAADLDYETAYLDEVPELGWLPRADFSFKSLMSVVSWQAEQGAAAQSVLRSRDRLMPTEITPIEIHSPPLTVVDRDKLTGIAAAGLSDAAVYSMSLATQVMREVRITATAQLVETFELF